MIISTKIGDAKTFDSIDEAEEFLSTIVLDKEEEQNIVCHVSAEFAAFACWPPVYVIELVSTPSPECASCDGVCESAYRIIGYVCK